MDGKNLPGIVQILKEEEKQGLLDVKSIEKEKKSGFFKKSITIDEADYKELLENFKMICDQNLDMIFQITKTGKITYVNQAVEKITGYNVDEVIGKSFTKFLPKKELLIYLKAKNDMIKNKKKDNWESYILHKEGHLVPVELTGTSIKVGNKTYIHGIMRDISKRKEAEEKLRKKIEELENSETKYRELTEHYKIITENTFDIIAQFNRAAKIVYVNSAVERLIGYKPEEVIGKGIRELTPKREWPRYFSVLMELLTKGEIRSFEANVVHKDGHFVPIEFSGRTVKIGNKTYIDAIMKDITERRKMEEERQKNADKLKSMNEELTELNRQLTVTNEELNVTQSELSVLNKELEQRVKERTAEIEKLLKQKDEFIGQLSHDLKSPLTPLVALLPAILDSEKDPKLRELLNVANRNVGIMRDLVVKTLKLERLNLPNLKLSFENTNLFELVERTINNKELYLKEKNLNIRNKINNKLFVKIDKLEFNELIDNLFNNAIKFTSEDGFITFDAAKDKDFIRISITDTGIGLTSEQIEHIFEEFYKVDASRHDLESSGLGLPICKRIVKKHDGHIWVESPGLGKGSTFYIELPLNKA